MTCAKMVEPIEMQFGMLSEVGPGNMYYMTVSVPPREGALFGASDQLTSFVKCRIWGLGNRVSCTKKWVARYIRRMTCFMQGVVFWGSL